MAVPPEDKPRTNQSTCALNNALLLLSGLHTIGSCTLNDVFSSTGTPVNLPRSPADHRSGDWLHASRFALERVPSTCVTAGRSPSPMLSSNRKLHEGRGGRHMEKPSARSARTEGANGRKASRHLPAAVDQFTHVFPSRIRQQTAVPLMRAGPIPSAPDTRTPIAHGPTPRPPVRTIGHLPDVRHQSRLRQGGTAGGFVILRTEIGIRHNGLRRRRSAPRRPPEGPRRAPPRNLRQPAARTPGQTRVRPAGDRWRHSCRLIPTRGAK